MAQNRPELFSAWKASPKPETLSPLLESLEPTINKALVTYGYAGDPNMRNTARIHLSKSLERFDPSKSNINTFAFNELKRLQRLGPKQRFAIPIPEIANLEIRDLNNFEAEYFDLNGRKPTDDEISDALGMSKNRLGIIRTKYRKQYVDRPISEDDRLRQSSTSGGFDLDDMWVDAVFYELDPIDKQILNWTTGRAGNDILSKSQIAKNLGMSVAAISQRAARIAAKLEEGFDYTGVI